MSSMLSPQVLDQCRHDVLRSFPRLLRDALVPDVREQELHELEPDDSATGREISGHVARGIVKGRHSLEVRDVERRPVLEEEDDKVSVLAADVYGPLLRDGHRLPTWVEISESVFGANEDV